MKGKTYSTVKVAKLLGISPRTVYRWLETGALPEPPRVEFSGVKLRLWRPLDIQRLRRLVNAQKRGTLRRVLRAWKSAPAEKSAPAITTSPDIEGRSRAPTALRQPAIPIAMGPAPLKLQNTRSWKNEFTPQDEVLTPDEVARRLKVKKSWLYEMTRTRASVRHAKPLPHVRVGKYLRFNWADVVTWLNELAAERQR